MLSWFLDLKCQTLTIVMAMELLAKHWPTHPYAPHLPP